MIHLDCPACRKLNHAPAEPVPCFCSRCGCELTHLRAILQAAAWHLAVGIRELKHRNHRAALRHGEISWSLRRGRHAAALAALATLALRDIASLQLWRSRAI